MDKGEEKKSETRNTEMTITFTPELKIGDRLFYNNPDGESLFDIFEIEVVGILVRVENDGANAFKYECKTPFLGGKKFITIYGLKDRVYRDLQEVADYKNCNHFSRIELINTKTFIVAVADVGVQEKVDGIWRTIVPCKLTKEERLNAKKLLH